LRITRFYKNFLTAIFIAIYAFAVSPAEYLHNHLFHKFDISAVKDNEDHGGINLKKAVSSCDTKCPICHHKLLGEEGSITIRIPVFFQEKSTGKILSFVPEFIFSEFFSFSGRGPPVLL